MLLALLMLVVGLLGGPLAADVFEPDRIMAGGAPPDVGSVSLSPPAAPTAGPGGAEVALTTLGGPAGPGGALARPPASGWEEEARPPPGGGGGGGVDRALALPPPLGALGGGGGVAVFLTWSSAEAFLFTQRFCSGS